MALLGGHGTVGRLGVHVAQVLEGVVLRGRETRLVSFYHQSRILEKKCRNRKLLRYCKARVSREVEKLS